MDEEKKAVDSQEPVKDETKEESLYPRGILGEPPTKVSDAEVPEEVQEVPEEDKDVLNLRLGYAIKELKEVRKDTETCLIAVKEIAKTVGELAASVEKWRKAGKF